MAIESDAPAFPVHPKVEFDDSGLTKREYFAVMILQGLLANDYSRNAETVEKAIETADELIAQL